MLISEAQCLILSVGEVKAKKDSTFKTSIVRVSTKEKRDPDTNEVVRKPGTFDVEVAIQDSADFKSKFTELNNAAGKTDVFLPCFFILRSFTYKEKNEEKLGKQLQLKRWWR